MEELRHNTNLDFKSIKGEHKRRYVFPTMVVEIEWPLELAVSGSGGHYIWDSFGVMHYIPVGWCELQWTVEPDTDHIWIS